MRFLKFENLNICVWRLFVFCDLMLGSFHLFIEVRLAA